MRRLEARNPPERPLLSAETGNVKNRRQDPRRREFGAHVFEIAELLRVVSTLYNYRVCVVEMIWTKLHAPHAGIEPVSGSRVRNGIFCCRGGRPSASRRRTTRDFRAHV
jgi:hypothetical protein